MFALSFSPHRLSRVIPLMVSLAAGTLMGTAFGHLLPESVERLGSGRKLSALLLGGFASFFVLEKLLGIWGDGYSENPHPAHHHTYGVIPHKEAPSSNSPLVTNLLIG